MSKSSCTALIILIILLVFILLSGLRIPDYIVKILKSIETLNYWQGACLLLSLYTLVSFPIVWGYSLLPVASGYLYGLYIGIILNVLCALCGVLASHLCMRYLCHNTVITRIHNIDSLQTVMLALNGDYSWKVVALLRLTPLPFGLQNAIFAASNINSLVMATASCIGLLPMQILSSYIGTTVRSMEEVIEQKSNSNSLWLLMGFQLTLLLILGSYFYHHANVHLNLVLGEPQPRSSKTVRSATLHNFAMTTFRIGRRGFRRFAACLFPRIDNVIVRPPAFSV